MNGNVSLPILTFYIRTLLYLSSVLISVRLIIINTLNSQCRAWNVPMKRKNINVLGVSYIGESCCNTSCLFLLSISLEIAKNTNPMHIFNKISVAHLIASKDTKMPIVLQPKRNNRKNVKKLMFWSKYYNSPQKILLIQ